MKFKDMTDGEKAAYIGACKRLGRWDLVEQCFPEMEDGWTAELNRDLDEDLDWRDALKELSESDRGFDALDDGSNAMGCMQVGGNHYVKHDIQPWDIIDEYELSFYEGNILKYLLRQKGDRVEDLKKAQHYLDKLIQDEVNYGRGL